MNCTSNLVVLNKKRSAASEAYKAIRTNLLFANVSNTRVFTVTSARAGEGKSTTVANLAISFAQTKHKTLLIDADMRKPSIHQYFGLSRMCGLSTFIAGKTTFEESIQQNEIENLTIMTSGPISDDPTELISSKDFKKFLIAAKEEYDVIIIDTPPVGIVTDAAMIATSTDGVIMVVSEGMATMNEIKRANYHIANVGVKLLGVVYNKIGDSLGSGQYYSYYRYYYGSEYYSEDTSGVRKKVNRDKKRTFFQKLFSRK